MTHKTKGIVLRAIKYGETSLVVTIFTELFGVQTYMVNGVRTSKKNTAKANYFQPAAILDMVVYHSENKSMQRIKEFSWAFLFDTLLTDSTGIVGAGRSRMASAARRICRTSGRRRVRI